MKATSLLHDSRSGIHLDADALARMNAVLSPCIMRGQSIRNVIANNRDVFNAVKERTVYDYIAGGLFDAKRGDLPEACSRRSRKKNKETKTNAKCRVGRNYKMFLEYCRVNGIIEWTELDTEIGRVGGGQRQHCTIIRPGCAEKRQSEQIARVNAPESKLAAPSTPQCHNVETQNMSPHQQIRCAYLCNGAFTFALYDVFCG